AAGRHVRQQGGGQPVRVLGAALQVDPGAEVLGGDQSVVAFDAVAALGVAHAVVVEFAEHPLDLHRPVPGGAHDDVDVHVVRPVGGQRVDRDPGVRTAALHVGDP